MHIYVIIACMTTSFSGKLEKIDDYRWRIPKGYMLGMQVPGVIFSDEKMIKDTIKDNAPQQIANAAHLPGIVKASMAMPDIHWGYGLPIGGVVATDIEEGGVITPGGVGYDINCLSGDTNILMDNGAHIKIGSFEKFFDEKEISCINFLRKTKEKTRIKRFLKRKSKNRVFEVETVSGEKIVATGEHPFWTKDGMIPVIRLKERDRIGVYPFKGVAYELPSDKTILTKKEIEKFLISIDKDSRGNGLEQILTQLEKRGFLPLKLDSSKIEVILKIMGYVFGDGNIYFNRMRGKGCVSFYGKKEDLEDIRKDINIIGYKCSKIYSRKRDHKITTMYDSFSFKRTEYSCKVSSSGFAALLVCLGVPLGNKTKQDFLLPKWLFNAPLWQKRLFLSAFFGAEMSSPKTVTGHGYNFYSPVVSVNKKKAFVKSGEKFLQQLSDLLNEFGVKSKQIKERVEKTQDKVCSVRLRLVVSSDPDNLTKLYCCIGYEYNQRRQFLANAAILYLRRKKTIIEERKQVIVKVEELVVAGKKPKHILNELCTNRINRRFLERTLYEKRKTSPRIAQTFLKFKDFLSEVSNGKNLSGMMWDEIKTIRKIDFDDYVYDFTVEHHDHNFIANGFVVSNCGVRLLKTNLEQKDVQGRMEELVNALFAIVPAGVGSKGRIKLDFKEEKKLLVNGAKWAVKKGYGWNSDIEYCEESGAMEGADPSQVFERAYKRGHNQAGTLGSGNHFLEVQVVDEIYNKEIAEIFGIRENQITVMIHTGSRGLGHQICGDYAHKMINLLPKFRIKIPDKQLACVPVKSEEGQAYLGAMRCAANYAWCNRQVIMHLTREAFERVFNKSAESLGMHLIYDVAHNIAKIEQYNINGKKKSLCVHRKGATRAYPPGHEDLPEKYKKTGQPVIIPGDMGRCSYLLAGTKSAEETFYSTCHGAGRLLSRSAAKRSTRGRSIRQELESKGVFIRYVGRDTLHEEVPEAYKDVTNVVDIVQGAGISQKIARMRPLGVIKG